MNPVSTSVKKLKNNEVKIIIENDQFKGEKGRGRFIKRKINSQYLKKYGLN